ncbi:hypothetical protein BRD18_02520 [Halobacteriales archaeon SW_7_71_33]|nr:MAG: hypothetical protein BRD18_02520 [Halobacteriales archaeon SW_7_71_33]
MLPDGTWLHPTGATYGLRRVAARTIASLASTRAETVSPGALPDGGTVAVAGRVEPYDTVGVVRPGGSRTPSVCCRVRVDAYPEPVSNPERRSFTDGSVALDDVLAVPFVLADGSDEAVVDPVPRAPSEGLAPAATVRPRAAYVTSDLRYPDEGLVAADRLRDLSERRRSWVRERTNLADDAFVRLLERRLSPGDRVRTVGHRVRHDRGVDRDVINVRSLRAPFRVEPCDR